MRLARTLFPINTKSRIITVPDSNRSRISNFRSSSGKDDNTTRGLPSEAIKRVRGVLFLCHGGTGAPFYSSSATMRFKTATTVLLLLLLLCTAVASEEEEDAGKLKLQVI